VVTPYLPSELGQSVGLDALTKGHFDLAKQGVFSVQQCGTCGNLQHPPRVICAACMSSDVSWVETDGRGTVFSYTIVHHGVGPLRPHLPYNVVLVQLTTAPSVRVVGNVVDVPPEEIQIGLSVVPTFEAITPDLTITNFRRDQSAT
jgi:uncharacterized OB-fold protein